MKKIGLIAGGGALPLEFLRSAKKSGVKVVVYAVKGITSPLLEKEAEKIYWVKFGQYGRVVFFLLLERISRIVLLGKIKREVIHKEAVYDKGSREILDSLKNKKDYSILTEITKRLGRIGIKVIDPLEYLSHLLQKKGLLTEQAPSKELEEDMKFGFLTAKELAGLDIGQTIIIKDRTVVAAEAMEGTDATIERGRDIAGDGCVMIKVSRPEQDMRWDVPAVGPETIKYLAKNNYSGLAIENGRMFLIEKERCIDLAKEAGITIKVF